MISPREIEEMMLRASSEFADPEERARFLDWSCRGEDTLRARLDKLWAIQQNSEKFFDFKPFDIDAPAPAESLKEDVEGGEIGLWIGRYRLIRRLGEGGCGVVYQAEQEIPVKRQVALKLIRMGLDHERVIARFEMERQALAMMDHPGIARVLDAGATPTGRPYFVMQWVTGEPITTFCNQHRLSIRQRLELFIRVCHAIQHAHQKGIIHRDIKPSNVLAAFHDGVPLPKVIDFGISKAIGGGLSDPDGEQETILGTPTYMSPEQSLRSGIDVDTRTDIYSLGVLLCEMLTGKTPFDRTGETSLLSAEQTHPGSIRKPKAPSALLQELTPAEFSAIASARTCKPRHLIRLVRGDLDAVVLKCLRNDCGLRYNTAAGLIADIERHLSVKPVAAHAPHATYLFGKLLRRNRLAFSVGAIVFLSLTAGLATSTWLYFRETEARREQTRLRSEAETARTLESSLRAQAEARDASAQAAVKLSYGRIEEADKLLAAIPTDMAPSSLEAAEAYRQVGDWHRKAGRIQQAAERYTALAGSIASVDDSDLNQVSGNLLPAAVTTCEVGDWPGYEKVRQIALERFANTQNSVVAEQMIKLCALRPADPVTMAKIAPLAAFLESAVGSDGGANMDPDSAAWHCYSLALWHHRRKDPAQTIRWAELSLRHHNKNVPRLACVRSLLAMSRYQQGETEEARKLLTEAAAPIRGVMEAAPETAIYRLEWWIDWLNAKILIAEAAEQIGN
jgi:tetratricopeptide (TPR) repeat protein